MSDAILQQILDTVTALGARFDDLEARFDHAEARNAERHAELMGHMRRV